MKLPLPKAVLAGCVWRPRILAKAKLTQQGELDFGYERMFCHAGGVDGPFLKHFSLSREDVLKAAAMGNAEACEWFAALPNVNEKSVVDWNDLAVNLGRKDYPMSERLPIAMTTTYKHLASRGFETAFEVLEADEE